jgi:hypothetical protein
MRTAAVSFVLLALLATAGSAARRDAPRPTLAAIDPDHPRALPAQGVVVQRPRDLLLLGLDGRAYGRLVGFKPAYVAAFSATSTAYQSLADAVQGRTAIVHRGARWYAIDAGGAIRRLSGLRMPLAGGIELVAHPKTFKDGGVSVRLAAERAGKVVMPGPGFQLAVSPSGLLSAGRTALDPRTGARWRIARDCAPAGTARGRLLAVCPLKDGKPPRLVAFIRSGAAKVLGQFPTAQFVAGASLSPGRRFIAAALSFGCGPEFSFVMPAAGGTGRSMLGETHDPFHASTLLGWSRGGRVVAYVDDSGKADCEKEPRAGIYAIDPTTFARRPIARRFGAMWGSDAAR